MGQLNKTESVYIYVTVLRIRGVSHSALYKSMLITYLLLPLQVHDITFCLSVLQVHAVVGSVCH